MNVFIVDPAVFVSQLRLKLSIRLFSIKSDVNDHIFIFYFLLVSGKCISQWRQNLGSSGPMV